MNHSTVITIDLAKIVFQICKMKFNGKVIFNKEMVTTPKINSQ